MRKEVIWATVIGISFGLIIAFGVWRINSSFNSKDSNPDKTPAPQNNSSELKITLDKPQNDDVVTNTPITVSGITRPVTWVTVSGEKGDYTLQSGPDGVFAQDVELTAGVNQIKITVFDTQGGQSVEEVLVVYSSGFVLKTVATPGASDASSDSAIRARVQEKVAQAMNKPKAYIGTVTDISDSTIQIKTTRSLPAQVGEIKQVSTNTTDVSVINAKGTANKAVKLTDVAIGDFIVAMGYVDSNTVLAAQRILISDPVTDSKVNASAGKASSITKKSISVVPLKGGNPSDLTPDKNTVVYRFDGQKTSKIKFADIAIDDTLIFVSSQGSTSQTVRSVFVVASVQS